jgi:hypothetical protein
MTNSSRFAIVTPYFTEPRPLLERCVQSVRRQTLTADHFLIADGFPQAWLDAEPVRHIKLDRAHGDAGNTPRGIGALMAISEGYEGIGFLDADNWLEPRHVELCLDAVAKARDKAGVEVDYVIAQRHIRRPDETIIPLRDEVVTDHVDTSCFFMLPGSYNVIPYFATMPPQLSAICDRVFYAAIKAHGLKAVLVSEKTVNFHCRYESGYRAIGEEPPAGAKPAVDMAPIKAWLDSLSPRELLIASRRSGVELVQGAPPAAPSDAGTVKSQK